MSPPRGARLSFVRVPRQAYRVGVTSSLLGLSSLALSSLALSSQVLLLRDLDPLWEFASKQTAALPRPWLLALCVGLAAVVLALLAKSWLTRWRRRYRNARRQGRAQAAERAAPRVLAAAGYEVESSQARGRYEVLLDGTPLRIDVRVDYLVRREGKRYAADVKTGLEATELYCAATRRQLLEYRLAYAVDGVLLVDMDRKLVRLVEFPD